MIGFNGLNFEDSLNGLRPRGISACPTKGQPGAHIKPACAKQFAEGPAPAAVFSEPFHQIFTPRLKIDQP